FCGAALSAKGARGKPVVPVPDSRARGMFKVAPYVMASPPLGVVAATAPTVGGRGMALRITLSKRIALMDAGLILFGLGALGGALVVLAATLAQFKLPLEGAAILLGIDQIMDMGRTAVNVMGNWIAAAVVARWEGVKI